MYVSSEVIFYQCHFRPFVVFKHNIFIFFRHYKSKVMTAAEPYRLQCIQPFLERLKYLPSASDVFIIWKMVMRHTVLVHAFITSQGIVYKIPMTLQGFIALFCTMAARHQLFDCKRETALCAKMKRINATVAPSHP